MWLLALLMSTGRMTVRGKVGPRGGFGRLMIEWLFFRYTLFFRINLFRQPYFSLQSVKKNGRTKRIVRGQGKAADRETPELPRPDTLELHFTVGVRDEPALCTLICGWLRESAKIALGSLLPEGWPDVLTVSAEPVIFDDAFFVQAAGMIMLTPVHIISIGIQMKKRGE